MTKTKNYKQYLVLDWRSGSSRTRKSKPSAGDLGKNELVALLEWQVNIPEPEMETLSLEIDVPEPMVRSATIEALGDDALPGWSDVANEYIDDYEWRFHDIRGKEDDPTVSEAWDDAVNSVVTKTLLDVVSARQDVERVREYVYETTTELYGDK